MKEPEKKENENRPVPRAMPSTTIGCPIYLFFLVGFTLTLITSGLILFTSGRMVSEIIRTKQYTPYPTNTPILETQLNTEGSPFEIAVLNINFEKQSDGTLKRTATLSISPLGLGSLQLTHPTIIHQGESSIIRLTITPDTVLENLSKNEPSMTFSDSNDYVLRVNDRVQIFPVMIAELRGDNFKIKSDNHPEKPVTSSMPVEWIWTVTPLSSGEQVLILEISIPVIIDKAHEITSVHTFKNILIDLQVEMESTPIPPKTIQPTPIPLSTITPTPLPLITQIKQNLVKDVAVIIAAIIDYVSSFIGVIFALIGVLITVFVSLIIAKMSSTRKNTNKK